MTSWKLAWPWILGAMAGCPAADDAVDDTGSVDDTGATGDTGETGAMGLPALCVNEFMASNQGALTLDDETAPDWIELHNPTAEPVSLGGWFVTDDLAKPDKHPLDDSLVVPAGGYLLLYADGDPEDGVDHLPFKLSAGGEAVAIVDPEGRLDGTDFGIQPSDYSLARVPDCCPDPSCWRLVFSGTPGVTNGDFADTFVPGDTGT